MLKPITSHAAMAILAKLGYEGVYDSSESWCSLQIKRAGKEVYFEKLNIVDRQIFHTPKLWDKNKVELTFATLRKKAFNFLLQKNRKEFENALLTIEGIVFICSREKEVKCVDEEHVKMAFDIVGEIRDQLNTGATVTITPNSIYGQIIKNIKQ